MNSIHRMHGYIIMYTDGSATNAIRDSGAGSIVYLQGGQQIENSAATRNHCTNYGAEVKALEQGAKAIADLTMTMTMTMK